MGCIECVEITYSDDTIAKLSKQSAYDFAVECFDEREEDAKAMWIVNLRPGFRHEHIEGSFNLRRIFDCTGCELGTIGPGARFFDDREDAARYRDELGPDLARAFVLAPVLLLPVHIGEAREGQDA